MGSNKRYPNLAPQLAQERELRQARKAGTIRTLSPDQLRLHQQAVTIAPEREPLWALAWLRFGDTDVRCTVRVNRWTRTAVGVEVDIDGETLRCWVWQGAVEHLAHHEDAWA